MGRRKKDSNSTPGSVGSLHSVSPRGSKGPYKDLVFYEELREIIDGKCATGQFATSSRLDDPATPAVTLSSFSRVSTLKRSNMCLDLIDENECQTDRPSKWGGVLPCSGRNRGRLQPMSAQ